MVTFGSRMREARKKMNLTLEELAEKLETTKATLSRYENNKRFPDIYVAKSIAKELKVDMNYLLYGDGEEVETIAAHHNGEKYTEEELAEIEAFKEFVKSRRKQE